jgi:hypothetical protein
MEELAKKLEHLRDLIKAIKKLNVQTAPKLPELPAMKAPPQPTMAPSKASAPKISSGQGPNSKKDPKKVAQQIKDGTMSTKTQKVMLKADSQTGQWYLEPTETSEV